MAEARKVLDQQCSPETSSEALLEISDCAYSLCELGRLLRDNCEDSQVMGLGTVIETLGQRIASRLDELLFKDS